MGSMKQIFLSAEFIPPDCGLGNYLELLTDSLRAVRKDADIIVRKSRNVDKINDIARKNLSVQNRSRWEDVIFKISTNRYPSIMKDYVYTRYYYYEFAKEWEDISRDSVCLLPHIPLNKYLANYYKSIMQKTLIWVLHDLHPYYFPEAWPASSLALCHRILPELSGKAKKIIVHNNFTLESAVKHLGAEESKISIIKLPHILSIDLNDSEEDDVSDVLRKYNIKKPYGLWASSSTLEHKNHTRLLNSWETVQRYSAKPIQLVCTGSKEPNWKHIQESLSRLKCRDVIIFTGTVPQKDYFVLLRNASFVVCPTLFEGGGCGPALEAAYAGIPAACADIPQIREQYDYREDLCKYFDPYNENDIARAVLELIDDPDCSSSMAAKAKSWTESCYGWYDVARLYWEVIEDAIR